MDVAYRNGQNAPEVTSGNRTIMVKSDGRIAIRENLARLYPEIGAGGFSRVDGTVEFYTRVNALLKPDFSVMDLGAGRGAQLRGQGDYRTELAKLQGKVEKLIGVDVDDAVLDNPFLDEAHVISIGAPYPFPDNSFDLILSDWVLEHVANPDEFVAEVGRVLKPGGWFCARTPNRWGMIGIGANLVPNSAHKSILAKLQPGRKSEDVFPTVYRMNTMRRLSRAFPPEEWDNYSYITNSEPQYVQRSILAMRAVQLVWRLAPARFGSVFNVFMRRKARQAS